MRLFGSFGPPSASSVLSAPFSHTLPARNSQAFLGDHPCLGDLVSSAWEQRTLVSPKISLFRPSNFYIAGSASCPGPVRKSRSALSLPTCPQAPTAQEILHIRYRISFHLIWRQLSPSNSQGLLRDGVLPRSPYEPHKPSLVYPTLQLVSDTPFSTL